MQSIIKHQKYYLDINQKEKICLHRFTSKIQTKTTPVFMLHGAMENSKIFHSKSKKGFAPFLAKNGFDVFAVDMRGKGESIPKVNKKSRQSQSDQIIVDIPICLTKIKELTNSANIHFVGHSWGGVLLLSYIARFPKTNVKSAVYFGSKRRISVVTLRRIFYIEIIWNLTGFILGKIKGYAPFKKLKAGSDDEPFQFYRDMNRWVYTKKWKDRKSEFDYRSALQKTNLPPFLYLTGVKDHTLGNQKDVNLLIAETGSPSNSRFILLSKENNNLVDYDHINILTHPLAEKDHFIDALNWISKYD